MKAVYEAIGISKQAHWKQGLAEARAAEDETMILNEVRRLRVLHPRMGGKKIYGILQPESMGRDRFLALLATSSLLVARRRNSSRTTFSVKSWRYMNLMEGLVINGVDQVWVSDITYFFIGQECFYIVMIMDVYSRMVLGYNVEAHMRAESCLAALEMAFKSRGGKKHGFTLIHHSDRGGQYVSDLYTGLLERMEARISMCLTVYENTHMERLNGTIKGEYLTPYSPKDEKDLRKKLAMAAKMYNHGRPHEKLQGMTPVGYEESLAGIPMDQRKPMSLYVDPATALRNKVSNQLTIFD